MEIKTIPHNSYLLNGDSRFQMNRISIQKTPKMLLTRTVGIGEATDGTTAIADMLLIVHLPLIRCECGIEILMLPDLRAMNHAIEAHVVEHGKLTGHLGTAESNRINQLLAQLTLMKAASKSTRQ